MAEKRIAPPADALLARTRAAGVFASVAFALVCKAWGQTSAPIVESLDRQQAEQERMKRSLQGSAKSYVDRVMDPSSLPTLADPDLRPEDADGFSSYYTESAITSTRSDNGLTLRSSTELGQRVGYRRQTLNYGEFVIEGDVRTAQGDMAFGASALRNAELKTSGRFLVSNLGFPITPTVFADTSIGDVTSEITEALSRTYRLSLGTSVVRGASTRITGQGFDLRAGTGLRGQLAGGPYPGFERTVGGSSWLGYSQRLGDKGYAGVQLSRVTDIAGGLSVPGAAEDVTSFAAAGGYTLTLGEGESVRGRIIGVSSAIDGGGSNSTAHGVFVEATYVAPGQRQEVGAYWSEPQLRFGEQALSSGARGIFWRVDTSAARLGWGLGADYEQRPGTDTGQGSQRLALNGNIAYRLDRHSALNATANFSQSRFRSSLASDALAATRSMYASTAYRTRFGTWGPSSFRLTIRRNEVLVVNDKPATGEELEWEQSWISGRLETLQPEFVTTLGAARERTAEGTAVSPTAGVMFRFWPDADWSVSGNLRYTARDTNLATTRGLSGTVDAERLFTGGWRAGASLNLNQAVITVPTEVLGAPTVSRTNDKSVSVYLRWDGSSGMTARGLGASPASAGAGELAGIVYFDANRDGEQQVGEAGVPDVELILDGRYRIRTGKDGRFVFPLVGTGVHRVTVAAESVPLPWGPSIEDALSVEVPLRGQANLRIPVVRVGN